MVVGVAAVLIGVAYVVVMMVVSLLVLLLLALWLLVLLSSSSCINPGSCFCLIVVVLVSLMC